MKKNVAKYMKLPYTRMIREMNDESGHYFYGTILELDGCQSTGDTIEEQVVELGARKKALFERLITPGETVLSAMSEQEIRALFE